MDLHLLSEAFVSINWSKFQLFTGLCILFGVIYAAILVTYRLVFSPIAKFPGPKLAAATAWYEFYFQFFKNGKFTWEIARLHSIYGPIIRVNPWELHIADPEFYDKVYVSGSVRPTDNYELFARGVEFEGSHFLSTGHDLHRRRRKPLEPYFSRAGVSKLESMMWQLAEKVVQRFQSVEGTGQEVRLDHAMLAFSGDVIGRICCENPTDLLDDPKFSPDWYNLLHDVIKSLPLFMGFPALISIVRRIPQSILMRLDSRGRRYNDWKLMAEAHIHEVLKQKASGKLPDLGEKQTLFQNLVRSNLPECDLTLDRLSKEAQVILGAGTVSTARTLDFICYYILSNRSIKQRLVEELEAVMSDYPTHAPTWAQLERLPFMQALIKEGLRYGVSHRMPRVSPTTSLQFKQWTIPPRVPVGMSAYCQHTDPSVFPEPFKFVPERWLPGNATPLMLRNLVPFSKGSRNCLGMNLAYAELNIMLAALFRPGAPTMELFETDESDVTPAHDFMLPLPRLDSKGIRIVIRGQTVSPESGVPE
ncbi:Nn.00g094320.m01.CDS01 [Neocucurbitaria sp. VM-36]